MKVSADSKYFCSEIYFANIDMKIEHIDIYQQRLVKYWKFLCGYWKVFEELYICFVWDFYYI